MVRYVGTLAAVLFGVWLIADESPRADHLVSAAAASDDSPANAIDDHKRGPRVPVRIAYHRGYDRIVFDWRSPVDYSVSRTGGHVVVRFDRAARLNLATLTEKSPTDIYGAKAALDGKQTSVTLSIDPAGRLRHFRSGTQVVLDVFLARAVAEAEPRSDQTIPVAEAALSPSSASKL